MNLYEGTRRILILAVLLWSPVALYMAWDAWPETRSVMSYPDSDAVTVGNKYLAKHPLAPAQLAEYRKSAAEYLERHPDYFYPLEMTANSGINSLAGSLAAHDVAYERWDLRIQVWFIKRADVWQTLGLYLILPIAAAFAVYTMGVPVLAWALAGFKAPPSSKPQD